MMNDTYLISKLKCCLIKSNKPVLLHIMHTLCVNGILTWTLVKDMSSRTMSVRACVCVCMSALQFNGNRWWWWLHHFYLVKTIDVDNLHPSWINTQFTQLTCVRALPCLRSCVCKCFVFTIIIIIIYSKVSSLFIRVRLRMSLPLLSSSTSTSSSSVND